MVPSRFEAQIFGGCWLANPAVLFFFAIFLLLSSNKLYELEKTFLGSICEIVQGEIVSKKKKEQMVMETEAEQVDILHRTCRILVSQ